MDIAERTYQDYLAALIAGDYPACHGIVDRLVRQRIEVLTLYRDLFQRSMVEIGELWENNRITVATEHLATSLTESLIPLAYPLLFHNRHVDRRVLITCVPGEYHQIGAHLVADYFEMLGWHGHTLGANMPKTALLEAIGRLRPDLVGFSVSISFNLPALEEMIQTVLARFPRQRLLVGGRAFQQPPAAYLPERLQTRYPGLRHIDRLADLQQLIGEFR